MMLSNKTKQKNFGSSTSLGIWFEIYRMSQQGLGGEIPKTRMRLQEVRGNRHIGGEPDRLVQDRELVSTIKGLSTFPISYTVDFLHPSDDSGAGNMKSGDSRPEAVGGWTSLGWTKSSSEDFLKIAVTIWKKFKGPDRQTVGLCCL